MTNKTQIYKEYKDVIDFLKTMTSDYPNIENWFYDTVYNGINNGTRKIFIKKIDKKIIALAIAKKTNEELKICTLKIIDKYQGQGIGIRLFNEVFNWLGTTKPKLSISEDKLPYFENIFKYFDFKLTTKIKNKHIKGKTELFYN